MKLSVGLINSTLYWDEFLNQAGISVNRITVNNSELNSFPVIIVNECNDDQKRILNNYVSNGGCIITEAVSAKNIFNIPYKKKKVEYFYSKADDVFNYPVYCEINRTLKIPAGANHLECSDNTSALLIKEIDKGTIAVFPDDFLKLIFSTAAKRKSFYSAYGAEFPTEKVSHADKNGITNIFHKVLEYLFHKNNLPFVRLWQFPSAYETIFGFRIDTDFADDDEIKNLFASLDKNKIKATWFVEILSRESGLRIFSDFTDQEIALHCYQHKNYSDKERNQKDIEQGLKTLRINGFSPKGYASPYGSWSESLGEIISNSDFVYSSEFGYIYDSLPMYPSFNGQKSGSIQVPIHPMSVGRLNIAGHIDADMLKYFSDIIDMKKAAYEPVILYTHPSQKRLQVFQNVFKIINDLNIPSLTFLDYAEWWMNRETIEWSPEFEEGKILFNPNNEEQSIFVHLSFNSGKNILSPINTSDLKSGKEINPKRINHLPGFNPELLKQNSLKILKQELIYNYRKIKN